MWGGGREGGGKEEEQERRREGGWRSKGTERERKVGWQERERESMLSSKWPRFRDTWKPLPKRKSVASNHKDRGVKGMQGRMSGLSRASLGVFRNHRNHALVEINLLDYRYMPCCHAQASAPSLHDTHYLAHSKHLLNTESVNEFLGLHPPCTFSAL